MPYDYKNKNDSDDWQEIGSWIPVILMLVFCWPIGLVLLFRKLTGSTSGGTRRQRFDPRFGESPRTSARPDGQPQSGGRQWDPSAQQARPGGQAQSAARSAASGDRGYRYEYHSVPNAARSAPGMQGVNSSAPRRKNVNLNRGKALTVWGLILAAIFGMGSLTLLGELMTAFSIGDLFTSLFPCLGFMGAGLIMAYTGRQRQKKAKRFRKYLALIGKRDSISITSLAQAMPVSVRTACDDLQEMLDEGMIPQGYLDMSTGRLVLGTDGLKEEPPAPQPKEEEEKPQDDNAILEEIRKVNDAIADPVMSRKIDRIGEITGKILSYQKQNPAKASQLRSFLNYYLPTTLKILNAYAQMEAQGISGENITTAKKRIEGMMDKVVEGFEKQLDKLFADSAMDITTDVEVLERMLDKDGLSSGGQGLTLGG